jgi:hypothetical protein
VDKHATKAVRSAGLVLEHFKPVPIVSVESVLRCEPQEAEVVLDDRGNSGLG